MQQPNYVIGQNFVRPQQPQNYPNGGYVVNFANYQPQQNNQQQFNNNPYRRQWLS